MTEEQARYIWTVLLDVEGQKDVVVEIHPATTENERKEAVA